MKIIRLLKYAAMVAALPLVITACDDDNIDKPNPNPKPSPKEMSFVVVSGDPKTDLSGGAYMKVFKDLDTNKSNQKVYGAEDALKSADAFTQLSYNPKSGVLTGYIYARAAAAEDQGGIGAKKAGLRSYKVTDGKLNQFAAPVYLENFGNSGVFGKYSYAAQISNPVVKVIDDKGVGHDVVIDVDKYAVDGVAPAIANIIDMGNNKVAMVFTYNNHDEAHVAFADYNLNITSTISSNKIGTSVGAQRSVRFTQSGADDSGNVYIFSGSSEDQKKVGALRIKKGETKFDESYFFDIFTASDGYRFRKVFHISGDKFLIEFYNSKEDYANMSASGKMAVVDMSEKSLKWVTGLPDPTTVSIAWGDGYKGVYYLPIAAQTSFGGGGRPCGNGGGGGRPPRAEGADVTPTIYKIDANTAVATPFVTFESTDLLKGVKILK